MTYPMQPMQGRDGITQLLLQNAQMANAPPVPDNNTTQQPQQMMAHGGMPGGAPPLPAGGSGAQGVGLGMPQPGQLPPAMSPQNVLAGGMAQMPLQQPTMPMPGQPIPGQVSRGGY